MFILFTMKQALAVISIVFFISCKSETGGEYNQRLVDGACHCREDAKLDLDWKFPDGNAINAMSKGRRDSLLQEEVPNLMLLEECMIQHDFKQKDVDNFWERYDVMKTFHCDSEFDLYQRYIFQLKHGSY